MSWHMNGPISGHVIHSPLWWWWSSVPGDKTWHRVSNSLPGLRSVFRCASLFIVRPIHMKNIHQIVWIWVSFHCARIYVCERLAIWFTYLNNISPDYLNDITPDYLNHIISLIINNTHRTIYIIYQVNYDL